MNKQVLLGMLNSKTINVNVLLTIAIIYFANSQGITIPEDFAAQGIALLYGGVNVVLRFFTNKSLPDKGISIPNPAYVKEFTKAIGNDESTGKELVKAVSKDPEALKQLHSALSEWIKIEKIKNKQGG